MLIVDDHPTFRRFARRLFEAAGFEVVGEAADGRSAVAFATELEPDLVLLDVMLPDMSGVDVARALPDAVAVLFVSTRSIEDLGLATLDDRFRFLRKDELSLEWLQGSEVAR